MPPLSPLEKRIKRRLVAQPHEFFAVVPPGLESLGQREIAALGLARDAVEVDTGGLGFAGLLQDGYKANLCLRTATRVLLRIATFKAADFKTFEERLHAVDWELYLPDDLPPELRVTCRKSRLYHSDAVAERLRSALARRPPAAVINERFVPAAAADLPPTPQKIFVRLFRDHCTVSLDSSGPELFRRGIKTRVTEAPLRENLAAAILMLAGYDGRQPLLDPMCGSGTFSIEAAMLAANVPAGWYRSFAFFAWPVFGLNHGRWTHLRRQLRKHFRVPERPQIVAADIDPEACRTLSANLSDTELAPAVEIRAADFFGIHPPADPGVVVLNPPYGRRIGSVRETGRLYREIGAKLQKDFHNWTVALVMPQRELRREIPFTVDLHPLLHGGLRIWAAIGRIP